MLRAPGRRRAGARRAGRVRARLRRRVRAAGVLAGRRGASRVLVFRDRSTRAGAARRRACLPTKALRSLADLRFVNRWLGGRGSSRRAVRTAAARRRPLRCDSSTSAAAPATWPPTSSPGAAAGSLRSAWTSSRCICGRRRRASRGCRRRAPPAVREPLLRRRHRRPCSCTISTATRVAEVLRGLFAHGAPGAGRQRPAAGARALRLRTRGLPAALPQRGSASHDGLLSIRRASPRASCAPRSPPRACARRCRDPARLSLPAAGGREEGAVSVFATCWSSAADRPAPRPHRARPARAGRRAGWTRRRFPRDKVCGEGVSPEAWRLLRELGAADAVRALAPQPLAAWRSLRPTAPRSAGRYRRARRRASRVRRLRLDARAPRHARARRGRGAGSRRAPSRWYRAAPRSG